MSDEPVPGTERYWQEIEAAADGGDVGPTAEQLIESALSDLDDPEDLLGAFATGEEDGILYALAASRKVHNGAMLLTLRYVAVDRDEGEARPSKNRIRIRVQGSVLAALSVLVTAVKNGDATPDSPMLLDARGEGLDHAGNVLTTSLDVDLPDPSPDEEESKGEGRSRGAHESVGDKHTRARRSHVECETCGQSVERAEAVNMGGALGADYWVHEGACPAADGEEVDDE